MKSRGFIYSFNQTIHVTLLNWTLEKIHIVTMVFSTLSLLQKIPEMANICDTKTKAGDKDTMQYRPKQQNMQVTNSLQSTFIVTWYSGPTMSNHCNLVFRAYNVEPLY